MCVAWWLVWSSRNLAVHSGKGINLLNVVDWVSLFVNETGAALSFSAATPSRRCNDVKWCPPNSDLYKISTDASIDDPKGRIGIGVIIKDCRGIVMASCVQGLDLLFSPYIAEALAILRGITLAIESSLLTACME
ncbi:hypothetical protein ACOSQ3_023618 [Xanthoceras sorbifolium]